jgi:hypothetical protein
VAYSAYGDDMKCTQNFTRKTDQKTPLRRLWEYNTETDGIGYQECGLDLSGPGYGPVANSCENSNEPSCSVKGEGSLDQLSDYSF